MNEDQEVRFWGRDEAAARAPQTSQGTAGPVKRYIIRYDDSEREEARNLTISTEFEHLALGCCSVGRDEFERN